MKKLIAALLMCCSTVAYGQTTVQQPATETTHQMGDDGSIKVTLPFTFTYYNKQFTDTWMYDNGVISFVDPTMPGSLSPWQWYAQPFNQVNANYYIASLWADIAPVSATKYITSTDGTYMKYTWQDIAEYYSAWGNWRLNTFSTTLKNDGTIETHYTNINLQTSAIGVGTVGDKNAGEVNQIYYSPCCVATTTAMIPDWTIAGVPPPPPPPEPVVAQPDPYVAPTVVEEIVAEAAPAPIVVNEPEPTVAVVTTTTPVATVLVQAATESSPASVTTASIAATTSAASDSSTNKMSIADAQSIARTNQKNAAQLVNSVVSSSIENSIAQTVTVDNDTSSSNDMVVSNTNTSSTSNLTSLGTQYNNSISDTGSTNNITATSSSMNLANFARLPGASTGEANNEYSTESRIVSNNDTIETNSQETKLTTSTSDLVNNITDEVNPTSVRSLAANNVPAKQIEEEQEKKNVEIADMNKDSSVSELAMNGVRLTELQVLPIGYNIYLAAILKDSAFYAPKAIYRNQTVVDNAPAQRLLKFASDAKFDQMVSQRYGEQK